MESSVEPAETRVARGMDVLIAERGERFDEAVDLPRLNINSCTNCMVGQLFGEFYYGLREFDHLHHGAPLEWARRHGFLAVYRPDYGLASEVRDAEDLTAAWRDAIGRRRARRLQIQQEVTA